MKDDFWKWSAWALGAAIGMWARIPHTTQILLLAMGLDFLSGLCAAINQRKLNSSVMFVGLVKKAGIFILIALVHIVEEPLKLALFSAESSMTIAFIAYEATSIIENLANSGVPIPAMVVRALAKVKVETATPEEIRKEFEGQESSTMTVNRSTEILRTADSSPDLKVEKVTTVLEEKHIAPIPPKAS